MLNIIKMDLYKMFKSKSFYFLNIVLLSISLFVGIFTAKTIMMNYEDAQDSNISWSGEDTLSSNDPLLTEKEYYEIQSDMVKNMDVQELIIIQYSYGIATILLAIFLSIMVCSELDTGFIKNIIPLKSSRASLVLSKNIIALLFIVIQIGVSLIGSIACTMLISGRVNIIDSKSLMIYLSLQALLRIAFASLIISISYMFKSKSTTMSIGIILALNVHGLFLNILDKVINISKLNLSELSIINNISRTSFSSQDYKRVILISVIYFILYNTVSTIRVKKMEVN